MHTLNWDSTTGSIENAEECREGGLRCGMAISKRASLLDRQEDSSMRDLGGRRCPGEDRLSNGSSNAKVTHSLEQFP